MEGDRDMDIKTIINNYIEELKTKYGQQEGIKILILKIMILIYPLLKEQGVGIGAPVALVVDSINIMESIMHDLNGVTNGRLSSTSVSQTEMRKNLEEIEYELVTMAYIKSQNSIPNLQILQAACQTGSIQDGQFSVLPVIFFIGAIAEDAKEFVAGQMCITPRPNVLMLSLCDRSNGVEFTQMLIRYICADWAAVKLETNRLFKEEDYQKSVGETPGAEMFFVAVKILELLLESQGYPCTETKSIISQCQNILLDIINGWHIISDSSAWLDILHNSLQQSSASMPGILNRHHVPAGAIDKIDLWPLYDEEFYYLPSKMFDELMTTMSQSISTKDIKGLLVEKGILVGEGRSRQYFTVKVPIVTEYGAMLEPRKLRLRREWLDLDGGLTWREKIEINAESEGK